MPTDKRRTYERPTLTAGSSRTDKRETYERPTLTAAGSFKEMTGLGGHGPRDVLVKHQLL